MEIKLIKTQEELETLLASHPKVIIKSSTELCGYCRQINPAYKEFAGKYTDIVFAEIDTAKGNLLKAANIPAFHTFNNGTLLSGNQTSYKSIVEIMLNDLQKVNQIIEQKNAPDDLVWGLDMQVHSEYLHQILFVEKNGNNLQVNEIDYQNATDLYAINKEICKTYNADINKNLHPFMVINAKGFENKQSPNNIVAVTFLSDGGITEAYEDKTTLYKQGDFARLLTNQKITGKVLIKVIIKDFE